jgi:hypothetical protein
MWILEQFLDISKRLSSSLPSYVFLAILLFNATSCVVTDTIEFEDEINHPFEIHSTTPPEGIVPVCNGENQREFKVRVWDMDEQDINNTTMKVFLTLDYTPTDTTMGVCGQPQLYHEQTENMGLVLEFTCSINLLVITKAQLYTVKIQISDKGFTQADKPKENAHTAEVTWVLEVEECDY